MKTNIPNNHYEPGGPVVSMKPRKTEASALLEDMAEELDQNVGYRPRGLGQDGDMELALLKFNQTMKDNETMRGSLAEAEGRLRAAQAEVEDTRRRLDELQFQRDQYANYSIEIKTRMENLLVMMDGNAAEVESAVQATMTSIENYVDGQVNQLRVLFAGNASTATKLIAEALEAAKAEAIARLQKDQEK